MKSGGGAPGVQELPGALLGLSFFAVAAGASAAGGCCLVVLRRAARVAAARQRFQALLAGVAGEEARIVITGATSGIGRELADQCLRHPSVSLLLGCRDTQRAAGLFPKGDAVRIERLDLLDLDSVQNFVDEAHDFLREGEPGLRMLVNNAGVMWPRGTPAARADPTWRTNFLSPFLLTELLARRRAKDRASLPLRIVQVSSRLERRSELSQEHLEGIGRGEVGERAYADSKRALMLWTSVRAQGLAFKAAAHVHCATPGMVDTDLGRHFLHPLLWPLTKPLRMLLLRSPAEGALGVAAAGLRPKALDSFGRYLDGEKELEDLVFQRMGDKQFANEIVKWATEATMLEQRASGYDR